MASPDDLIHMLASMQTTDRDTLIEQFSRILQCDANTSAFFLESSNWNVELAVNTYLSAARGALDGGLLTSSNMPRAQFLTDLSPLQSIEVPPGRVLNMVWSFKNTGSEPWPADTKLVHVDGQLMDGPNGASGIYADPGQQVDLPVMMNVPDKAGTHYSNWRLTYSGGYFGDQVWLIVNVTEKPILTDGSTLSDAMNVTESGLGSLRMETDLEVDEMKDL